MPDITPEQPIQPELQVENQPQVEKILNTETLQNNVVQENAPVQQPQSTPDPVQPVITDDMTINQEEVVEEFSENVESEEKPWIEKAKEVIKTYADQPYQETEAAEDLEEEYLEKRFGVTLEKDTK